MGCVNAAPKADIDWTKIPPEMMANIKAGKPPTKDEMTQALKAQGMDDAKVTDYISKYEAIKGKLPGGDSAPAADAAAPAEGEAQPAAAE